MSSKTFKKTWSRACLANPRDVTLGSSEGQMLRRAMARLSEPPYTATYLLADVSFKEFRAFTNFSGDVSGRFLELATLTSMPEHPHPATLPEVLDGVGGYQKPDGHFGHDFDLSQEINVEDPVFKVAPLPMLWGNARLLLGLVTASNEFGQPGLLETARKLGDFYVNSSVDLCSPDRADEFRASGTDACSYTCCYFPAIEGLAMLHLATKEACYLRQAEKMAEHFKQFDQFPVDHSHGNLCAYRGILMLHEITGKEEYLDRAVNRWDEATSNGCVWPTGGIGEHWYPFYHSDECCSESDWLRFNLELWRQTGQTRYLHLPERLLKNHYPADQSPNGGFGVRVFEGDEAGPHAMLENLYEAPYCCSMHGPLGLHFLKGYLAVGNERDIYVNTLLTFESQVRSGGALWSIKTETTSHPEQGQWRVVIEATPRDSTSAPVAIWVNVPEWAEPAGKLTITDGTGASRMATAKAGYLELKANLAGPAQFVVEIQVAPTLEGPSFKTAKPHPGEFTRLDNVSILAGPYLLFAPAAEASRGRRLLAMVDTAGALQLLRDATGNFATVELTKAESTAEEVRQALNSARPVMLRPWDGAKEKKAFVHNVLVVPAEIFEASQLEQFKERAASVEATRPGADI